MPITSQLRRPRRAGQGSDTPMTAVPTSVASGAPAVTAGHSHVAGALRSEWTKLRTVRSTMWTLLATAVLGIGFSIISVLAAKARFSQPGAFIHANFNPTRRSLTGVIFAQLAIGILGVLVMSAEYSTGTIRATLSAIPKRPVVLAAKAAVFGLVAIVASEVVTFVAFFSGQAIFSSSSLPHATLSQSGVLRAVAGSGLYLTLLALFALGLASVIRHTAGSISAFVGVLLILPLLANALPTNYQNDIIRFLPINIGVDMVSAASQANTFSPWVGMLVLACYAVGSLVIGGVLLVRRDA